MIDYCIIVIYLLLTLAIGYFSGKNVNTVKDYSVSDRKFSNMTMLATIFASWLGGAEIFGTAEKTYRCGLIFVIATAGYAVNMMIVAKWMTKKIAVFKNALSLGDIMDSLYGKIGRYIGGISVITCIGIVGAQIAAIGYVCNIFLGLNESMSIIIGGVIVILYSSFGGIRAVTFTDILQFSVLLVSVPVVISIMLGKAGGFEGIINSVPMEHLSLIGKPTKTYLEYIVLFIVLAIPCFDPPFLQRILMSKNVKQAEDTLFIASFMHFPFMILVGIAGLATLVVLPSVNPDIAFPSMVNLVLPVGLKGLAVAGILAVIMSTVDSYLNVIGISFIRDIVKPSLSHSLSDSTELFLIRGSTVAFGILSMLAATSFSSIMDILLFTGNFDAPLIVIPMFFGIIGMRVSATSCLVGIVCASTFTLYWITYVDDPTLIGSFIPSLLISAFTTYISDKIEKSFFHKAVEWNAEQEHQEADAH